MASRALTVCLLLLSACATPPAPRAVDPRLVWTERIQAAIQLSWGRKELENLLDEIRTPGTQRPSRLDGGGFSIDAAPMTFYDLYSLDETFSLYVVWRGEDARRGIRSMEVVGLPDLGRRIDPELVEAVAAIHRSPSAERGLEFGSLRLIRAVNALQLLGKEKALKALWAYDRLAHDLSYEERQKYQVDEYRILPLVRLLFEGPGGRRPPFLLGAGDVADPGDDSWPLFPIVLVQDVPFMMVSGYALAGKAQSASAHLRGELGPMRAAPLAPRATPLDAADELTQSAVWKSLKLGPGNEGRKKWQIRRQALGAVASIFALRPEESSNDCCVDPTETQWRAAVERAASSGLIWSPEIQDFILGR